MSSKKNLGKRSTSATDGPPASSKRQRTQESNGPEVTIAKKTRADKPDFAPLYKEHRRILESQAGVDVQGLIDLRREIHKHAEGEWKV